MKGFNRTWLQNRMKTFLLIDWNIFDVVQEASWQVQNITNTNIYKWKASNVLWLRYSFTQDISCKQPLTICLWAWRGAWLEDGSLRCVCIHEVDVFQVMAKTPSNICKEINGRMTTVASAWRILLSKLIIIFMEIFNCSLLIIGCCFCLN